MADGSTPEDQGSQEVETFAMPESVIQMWDLMIGIDPTWDIKQWLNDRAIEQMELLSGEFEQEHLRTRQRLFRLENLSRRFGNISPSQTDSGQSNLFDEFALSAVKESPPHKTKSTPIEETEPSPLSFLTDYFPDTPNDDPLLALVSHLVLLELESAQHGGSRSLTGKEIHELMTPRGIDINEVEEAIDHLLKHELIIEIDDDVFIPY